MQNVNSVYESDRVNSSIGISRVILDDLSDLRITETFKGLSVRIFGALLSAPECRSYLVPDFFRKAAQDCSRITNPSERF